MGEDADRIGVDRRQHLLGVAQPRRPAEGEHDHRTVRLAPELLSLGAVALEVLVGREPLLAGVGPLRYEAREVDIGAGALEARALKIGDAGFHVVPCSAAPTPE